jgi:hypothetical protein
MASLRAEKTASSKAHVEQAVLKGAVERERARHRAVDTPTISTTPSDVHHHRGHAVDQKVASLTPAPSVTSGDAARNGDEEAVAICVAGRLRDFPAASVQESWARDLMRPESVCSRHSIVALSPHHHSTPSHSAHARADVLIHVNQGVTDHPALPVHARERISRHAFYTCVRCATGTPSLPSWTRMRLGCSRLPTDM